MSQQHGQQRDCSRTGCTREAVATLTYDYAGATAVVGPLSVYVEPHCYDLCAEHAQRFSAPRGWQVISMLDPNSMARAIAEASEPDDLLKLANAVRETEGSNNATTTTVTSGTKRKRGRLEADAEPAKPQEKSRWLRLITSGE